MPNLSQEQLLLLAAAAGRPDGSVLPAPVTLRIRDAALDRTLKALLGRGLITEREPLVIGAIGVAVGAAIGALLPATQLERQNLGPTGKALKDEAAALVDRGVTAAKEAASEIYATARDEADRQGLRPGDSPISEKIGAVVRAVGETAGAVAERHAPDRPGNIATDPSASSRA